MEALIRWERLLEEIRTYDPKAGKGRAPYGLESMLRVHGVQLFYNLSDPATENMLYGIEKVRRFTGISLSKAPDETTILNFRHLLERHGLPQVLFEGASGRRRADPQGKDDCGCQHHGSAHLDEEPEKGTGSGDEADPEGKPVALRHEAPCGSG